MWMAAKPFAPVMRTLLPGAMAGMLFCFPRVRWVRGSFEVCGTRKFKMPGSGPFYREIPSSKRHPARLRAPNDTSGSPLFLASCG